MKIIKYAALALAALIGLFASVLAAMYIYDHYMSNKIEAERVKVSSATQALAAQFALQEDQLSYAMLASSAHKVSVAEWLASESKLPDSNQEIKMQAPEYYASDYLSGVAIMEGGVVYAYFKDFPGVGKSWVRFVPSSGGPEKPIQWKCESNIPNIAQLRPICAKVQ